MRECKFTPKVAGCYIVQIDQEEQNESSRKRRGGARVGSGRKSFYGDVETAMYKLPKECAKDCQEYARVIVANDGHVPMVCVDGVALHGIQLPIGHASIMEALVMEMKTSGVHGVSGIKKGFPLPDCDNVVIEYTDVNSLIELIRRYGYRVGKMAAEEIKNASKVNM